MALERKPLNKEEDKKSDSYFNSSMHYIKKAFYSVIPDRKINKPVEELKPQPQINEENRIVFSLFLPVLNRPHYLEESEWNVLLDNVGGYSTLRKTLNYLTESAMQVEESDCEKYVNIAYFLHKNIVNIDIHEIQFVQQFINQIISSMTFQCASLSTHNHLKMAELLFCWGNKLPDKIPFGIFHAQYASKMANTKLEELKSTEPSEPIIQQKMESFMHIENANFFMSYGLKDMEKLPAKIKKLPANEEKEKKKNHQP